MNPTKHHRGRIRYVAAAAAAAVLATGLAAGTQASTVPDDEAAPELEDQLVIVMTGGATLEAFTRNYFEPFSEETGVEVIPVGAGYDEQWARIVADSESGNIEWDIVNAGATGAPESWRPYLQSLGPDCSDISTIGNAAEGSCKDDLATVRGGGGLIMIYDTDEFGDDPPTSVADLWDVEKYPGPRSFNTNEGIYTIQMALLADGVPLDELYPLDLDRAFAKLDELRPHIDFWWTSPDESQQLWRDGSVVMGTSWSGRARILQEEGLPIGLVWAGGSRDAGSWAILADAPHPNAARAFIDFFYRADEDALQRALTQAEDTGYDVSIPALLDLLPEEEKQQHYLAAGNWDSMAEQDIDWLDENRQMVLDRWNAWLAGG